MRISKFAKYLYFTGSIIKGHILGVRLPICVILCVTNKCNLRCIYCYEEFSKGSTAEFNKEQIFALIDELYAMGTRYISLNGGECLLREDIGDIIDKVLSKGIICHVSTNGLLIKDKIQQLKKVDSLTVSIDGKGQSHDINRGAGTYNKVIEALEALIDNKIVFQTHTVLTKNNIGAIDEIMELAQRYDFKAQFSILRHEDSPTKQINLSDIEIKQALQKILDYKNRGYPIFFSAIAYRYAINWPFTYETQFITNGSSQRCYLKDYSCHIEPDGLVYPCVVLVNKFKALNLKDVGFKKAWENIAQCKCETCYNICHRDLNYIFALKPAALCNGLDIVYQRLKKRK